MRVKWFTKQQHTLAINRFNVRLDSPNSCYKRYKEASKENLYVDHTLEAVRWTDAVHDADSGQTLPPEEAWY